MKRFRNRAGIAAAALAMGSALAPQSASALTLNYSMRTTGAFELDGPRDLRLNGGRSNSNGFLDLQPRLLIEFNPLLTGYIRGRGFIPTGKVQPFENGAPSDQRAVGKFGALDEFWLQFNGLTSYPGESIRVGRQLIRQDDATWIGQDADSIRFVLDSTLFSTDLGVIRQFSTYRTDNEPLFAPQRQRIYGFARIGADWRPGNRVSLRVLHARDENPYPVLGSPIPENPKLSQSDLTWIGLYAENGYTGRTEAGQLVYRADVSFVTGTDNTFTRFRTFAGPVKPGSVGAFESSGSLRWQPLNFPLLLGASYSFSQGGGSAQYRQAGLQANATYFTGTPTLIHHYNETLRAELGNMHIATAFIALNLPNNDASLVFNNFRKDDGNAPIVTDNVSVRPINNSRDVGNGLDLILSHYFASGPIGLHLGGDDEGLVGRERTSVRLRASIFDPGAAYGPDAARDYRVILEGVLWVH